MAIAPKKVVALRSGAACRVARDDARLVAALRSGEDGAFARLVTEYQTAIYNLAWRLVRDREDARDITQEVFLKAYRQIPRIEGELHLWAWLYRVTVNACYDHLRAGIRRPVPLGDRQAEADREDGDGLERAELAGLFAASLAQLPQRQQVALLLKDVHGLQHSDIAAALGITRGSSEVLLFRARRSFRNAFTSLTADGGDERVCRFAEQAAAHSVGGRLTEARRRRVLEHARTCADCRRTVERWSGAHAVGLGLALPLVAAPQIFGAHAAAAATHLATSAGASAGASAAASAGASAAASAGTSAGASAAASAGASVAASAGTAAATSVALTTGASSVAGGLSAKLAGLGIAKAAVVVVAAASVASYGGATVYRDQAIDGGRRAPPAPAAVAPAVHGDVASPGPVAAAAAGVTDASVRVPVLRQGLHPRHPGLRRAHGRDGLRLRRVAAAAPGLARQARRALRASGQSRRAWQDRAPRRLPGERRHGARVAVGLQRGVRTGIGPRAKVRPPSARVIVRQGIKVRPPAARSAARAAAGRGEATPRAGVDRVRTVKPPRLARQAAKPAKVRTPLVSAADAKAKPRPVSAAGAKAKPRPVSAAGAKAKPRPVSAAGANARQVRLARAVLSRPVEGPRADRMGVRQARPPRQ